MLNIAICDDEVYVHDEIKKYLQLCEAEEPLNIDCFLSGESLLSSVENETYDLTYLDIKMPGETGIEIAKMLRQRNCSATIIFLTNYDEYLEVGYEVEAFRYRFKPIDKELFQRDYNAWKKWRKEHSTKTVTITTVDGNYPIAVDDIIYVEIVKRKVQIITQNALYIALEPMPYWENLLTGFASPYNKILVNKRHVKFFNETKVIMTGDHQLPVSRRKYQQFCAEMLR